MGKLERATRGMATLGYSETVRKAVGLIVAGLHRQGDSEADIRSKVEAAAKEALEGDKEWEKKLDFGRGPETSVSNAGIFRIVLAGLNVDRNDLREQETFYRAVTDAIDPALTDAVFGLN